jgi:uncharacterized protein YndB with AHSA1/START domain
VTTNERGAVVRRALPARREVVYDEWLDPDALAEWMCPRPARATAIALDPEVGGTLRIDIEESGTSFYVVGTFIALERPSRLSFTWHCSTWDDADLNSVVTVTLDEFGADETMMTIHHDLLPPDLLDSHLSGWEAIAAQLHDCLRSRGPGSGSI